MTSWRALLLSPIVPAVRARPPRPESRRERRVWLPRAEMKRFPRDDAIPTIIIITTTRTATVTLPQHGDATAARKKTRTTTRSCPLLRSSPSPTQAPLRAPTRSDCPLARPSSTSAQQRSARLRRASFRASTRTISRAKCCARRAVPGSGSGSATTLMALSASRRLEAARSLARPPLSPPDVI